MTYDEVKKVIYVSMSAYSTHSSIDIEEWLRCQDARRKHPTVKKQIAKFIKL